MPTAQALANENAFAVMEAARQRLVPIPKQREVVGTQHVFDKIGKPRHVVTLAPDRGQDIGKTGTREQARRLRRGY